jgi:cobalt/nickel transport system permease protein
MHIPDGYLDPVTVTATYSVFALYLAVAFRRLKNLLTAEKVSLITVLAATIFAAQMLNWPLPGGTSLHFVGGALAGILLGPWLGFIAVFLVLFVQCLVFHDGGITALGANVINMAIIDVLVGYSIYKVFTSYLGKSNKSRFVGAFIGGWLGIALAGVACGVEIGLSGQFIYGLGVTVPVMGIWHTVLGLIEGLITALVIAYISARNPHLILSEGGKP